MIDPEHHIDPMDPARARGDAGGRSNASRSRLEMMGITTRRTTRHGTIIPRLSDATLAEAERKGPKSALGRALLASRKDNESS